MSQYKYLSLAIFSQLVLTLVPIGIKATHANIWEIGIIRLIFALAFITPFVKKSTFKNLKRLSPLGLFFSVHWLTYAHSVKTSNPSTAVIGLSFYGIILLFYSKIFLRKNIQPIFYFLIFLAFIGTKLTISDSIEMEGFFWGFISSLFYAGLPIINIKNKQISTKDRVFFQFFVALIIYIGIGAHKSNMNFDKTNWLLLFCLGLGGTLIGHGLWLKVTTHLSPVITGGFYYMAIPLALFYEYALLDLKVTPLKLVGCVIIVFSNLVIIYLQKNQATSK